MKERKPNRKSLIKKLDSLVIEIIRLRDNYTCQHCGKKVDKSNAHVSHVIPRSAGNKLRWDLNNLKVLCFHCHINWWHKNPTESGEWFKQKFPVRWKYLEENKGLYQFKTFQLEILRDELEAILENEKQRNEEKAF
jgi:5-methylcytosine-specific restriction endonuclease McrA